MSSWFNHILTQVPWQMHRREFDQRLERVMALEFFLRWCSLANRRRLKVSEIAWQPESVNQDKGFRYEGVVEFRFEKRARI